MTATTVQEGSTISAEERLTALNLTLPSPPQPFGTYTEAAQTGNLLFPAGCFPRKAAPPCMWVESALNALALVREHLGSLNRVTRIVRLGVLVATSGDVRDQPKVADDASDLLQDVFGRDRKPSRLVYSVASLPLGTPVELELIFEVQA